MWFVFDSPQRRHLCKLGNTGSKARYRQDHGGEVSARDGHESPVRQFVMVCLAAEQVFGTIPPPPLGTHSEALSHLLWGLPLSGWPLEEAGLGRGGFFLKVLSEFQRFHDTHLLSC